MVSEKMYDKLANLVVIKGVNVQKDQPVVIRANVRDAAFVRKIVKCAYEAGSGAVSVEWSDNAITKMAYEYESVEALSEVPQWKYDKVKHQHDRGACYISVLSDPPGVMADVDGEKIKAANRAYYTKMADLMTYTMNNEGQWSVIGVPSVEWANKVFPELDEKEAYEKLGDAIFAVTRVTEDNDPIEEWNKHDAEMLEHASKMNEFGFEKLHFTAGNGTDLYVELVRDHIWIAGGSTTPGGIFFDPNMPTEEIFTSPRAGKCEGTLVAVKPLSWNGQLIEDFSITFSEGKAVSCKAAKGQELLEKMLHMDEGACMLGEVALVPKESPVNRCGFLFYSTLFDENACCHFAVGQGFKEVLPDGDRLTTEEATAAGINDSIIHVDFMVGAEDLSITGFRPDGSSAAIFRNGTWAE